MDEGIEFFARKSGGTALKPCHATVILDATDINSVKRIDKTGKPERPFQMIGGEEAEELTAVLEISDTRSVEDDLNKHATPLLASRGVL